ncbi:hypothetical protein VNO80_29575 [Phaseolus coccineus]|uniref:Uncharacterized protein n=1 Tax=Phaseolus coccineus TaxID=3886 RepID=A0AAN9LB56_PHACN
MASVQDAKVPTTLKETETTNKEVTNKIEETIPRKSGIEVPDPEAASTEQSKEEPKEATTIDAAVPIIVETKEVVIEKTEEKAREVTIEDPTAKEIAEAEEDEKPNEKTEA